MKILAFDFSSPVVSVAFVSSGSILFRYETPHRRTDSAPLFEGLQAAINQCGLPEALCVGLGPGSYNGLRAALAAARAMATALDIPLYAIPSTCSLPSLNSEFWVVGDARGGHYWIACIQNGTFLEEARLLSPAETCAFTQTRPDLPILGSAPLPDVEHLVITTPDAALLAILSEKADPCVGTPEPLYLKPPHITAPRSAVLR